MPSVSINEAWGESNLLEESLPTSTVDTPEPLSARKSTLANKTDAENTEITHTQQELAMMLGYFKEVIFKHDTTIEELKLLRHEQTRRCTMYLTVTGVLFAIFFLYIDRLQQQVRLLNSFMIQRQTPTLIGMQPGFGV